MTLQCLDIALAAGLCEQKRQGSEHYFLCLWYDDRNPSLEINSEKNIASCFPCNKFFKLWAIAAALGMRVLPAAR